jgi:hypothetical protein
MFLEPENALCSVYFLFLGDIVMRSLSTVVVVALVFGALLCVASSALAAPVVLFQDDFEAYSVGSGVNGLSPVVGSPWAASSSAVVADVTTDPAPGATNSGKFYSPLNSNGSFGYANPTTDGITASVGQVITFKMDVYQPSVTTAYGGGIGAYGSTSGYGQNIFDLVLRPNGVLEWYNAGDTTLQTAGGTFATDTWIPVTIVADLAAKTYTADVGGVTVSDVFNSSAANQLGQLFISPNTFRFDNLLVTIPGQVPEPSTFLLIVTGLLGLLAYAWRKRK